MIDKNEQYYAAVRPELVEGQAKAAFCVSPWHIRRRRFAQYDEDLGQYEVSWCRTKSQSLP
jgi:hypothetical protein